MSRSGCCFAVGIQCYAHNGFNKQLEYHFVHIVQQHDHYSLNLSSVYVDTLTIKLFHVVRLNGAMPMLYSRMPFS